MAVYYEVFACLGADTAAAERTAAALVALPQVHAQFSGVRELPRSRAAWVKAVPVGVGYAVPADRGARLEEPSQRAAQVRAIYDVLRPVEALVCATAGFEIQPEDGELADDDLLTCDGVTLPAWFLEGPGVVVPRGWHDAVPDPERLEPFRAGWIWDPRFEAGVTL